MHIVRNYDDERDVKTRTFADLTYYYYYYSRFVIRYSRFDQVYRKRYDGKLSDLDLNRNELYSCV